MKKKWIHLILCATVLGTITFHSSTTAMAAATLQEGASFVTQKEVTGFYGDLVEVKEGDNYGYMDTSGTMVHKMQWSQGERNFPQYGDGDFIIMQKDGLYGLMDAKGKVVVKPQYDGLQYSQKNLYLVSKHGKHGCIDATGKIVIPMVYDRAPAISENKAIVQKNGKYSCVNLKGEVITTVDPVYQEKGGKEKQVRFADVFLPSEGLMAFATTDGGSGFINEAGKIIFYKEKSDAVPFMNGVGAINGHNETATLINAKGEVLKTVNGHVDKITENNRIFIRKQSFFAIMDNSGKLLTDFRFRSIKECDSKVAIAKGLDGLWNIIDLNGNIIGDGDWLFMTPCKGGLVIAEGVDGYVLLDQKGNIIGKKTWEYLGEVGDGSSQFIYYRENGKVGLLDGSGNIILTDL